MAASSRADPWLALCEWALRLRLADIPSDVRQAALRAACDDLACAAAGSRDAEAAAWAGRITAGAGAGPAIASVAGPWVSTTAAAAACRNAIHANWWQLDGGHHEVMCHASLYCMPAALAEAQARGAGVGDFVRALVTGYELTCRLAAAAAAEDPVLHPHGTWSGASAFASLSVLRGTDAGAMRRGLLALLRSAPRVPFQAVIDGDLAANTLVGVGMLQAFALTPDEADEADEADETDETDEGTGTLVRDPATGLGATWALRKAYCKPVACGGQAMPALEATLAARSAAGAARDAQVLAVDADLHAFAAAMMNRDPRSSLAARFSIPHVVAVAWVHGRVDPQALGGEFLADPQVRDVRARVVFSEYRPARPPPHHRAARITVTTSAGAYTGECLAARGTPSRPLTAAELRAKVRSLAGTDLERFLLAAEQPDDPSILSAGLASLLPRR